MFIIIFIVIDTVITLLFFAGMALFLEIFKFADFLEDIGKKLPDYIENTFKKAEHPWRTAFSDFWKCYHKGFITFILLTSPFITKGIVTMTDISSVDKPYNCVQNFINRYEDKLYYRLEEKYEYHTIKMRIVRHYPFIHKLITYPVASNRYERRLARQSAYVAARKAEANKSEQ